MTYNYRPFLNVIEPLLLDSSSNSIPTPYIIRLHPGTPSLELGAVSSLYELSFNRELDPIVKTTLGIETQQCRFLFMGAAQGISNGDLFQGIDAAWVEQYHPNPPTSPPSAVSESAVETKRDGEIRQETLLVITEWASQDGEKTILDSDRIEDPSSGEFFTTGEYFSKNMLQRADEYTKHHVAFENVSKTNVEWLDKEEKWSTYVARLLAEEDERRRNMISYAEEETHSKWQKSRD